MVLHSLPDAPLAVYMRTGAVAQHPVYPLCAPLLIYRLTGSALNLAWAAVAEMLPYVLFGLLIGAWVDRLDRKRLMIVVDLLQALVLASLPAMAAYFPDGILSLSGHRHQGEMSLRVILEDVFASSGAAWSCPH